MYFLHLFGQNNQKDLKFKVIAHYFLKINLFYSLLQFILPLDILIIIKYNFMNILKDLKYKNLNIYYI